MSFWIRRVERRQVLQGCAVTKLILILGLYHGWTLSAKSSNGLEDIHHALVLHALQHDAEGDEDAGATNASTEMFGH